MDRIAHIKEKYDLISYAHDVLRLPIYKPGDRCVSFAPGSKNPTAVLFDKDTWYDFKMGTGGDIIDLCAVVRHDGDKGLAIQELAGDYSYNPEWRRKTEIRTNKILNWHLKLRECDYRYLRRRRIYKSTVDRLKIGYDETEDRLIIPYWKNGYVPYYIGRDRSGKPEASKYKKAFLDGHNENLPWGLHTFEPSHRSLIEEQIIKQKSAVNDTPVPVIDPLTGDTSSMTAKKILAEKKIRNSDVVIEILNSYAIIAEGAFDALSFEQEGFKVLSPISGYFNKDALKQVVTILKAQKRVFVCFDSDKAGTKFTVNMCKTLFQNRVKFVCGVLPDGFKDVSEFYEAGGDLFDLVENARPGIESLATAITDEQEFKEFIYSAARFVEKPDIIKLFENTKNFSKSWLSAVRETALKTPPDESVIKDLLNSHILRYLENDGFYEYSGGVWKRRSDNFINGLFTDILGTFANGGKLSSLERVLKSKITTEDFFNKKNLIVFRNCTLDLDTGETHEHSCSDMSTIQMNYDYDPEAKCPQWEKFIYEVMDGKKKPIQLIQEALGYVLFTDCSLQKCFILKGEGGNGKSVFLNVAAAVFNDANVSNIEMSALIEPFHRIYLKDSLINISTETNSNVKGAESYFKQAVTGDKMAACYKGKNFISFRPRAKLFMACNDFMKASASDKAFLRRLIFIGFNRNFENDNPDLNLESKLLTELAGIFNWILIGYKRLKTNKKFTDTPEHHKIMCEFMEMTNPIFAFINEEMKGVSGEIERSELYLRYTTWAKNTGHEAQNKTNFTRNFKKTAFAVLPGFDERKSANARFFVFKDYTTAEDLLNDDED